MEVGNASFQSSKPICSAAPSLRSDHRQACGSWPGYVARLSKHMGAGNKRSTQCSQPIHVRAYKEGSRQRAREPGGACLGRSSRSMKNEFVTQLCGRRAWLARGTCHNSCHHLTSRIHHRYSSASAAAHQLAMLSSPCKGLIQQTRATSMALLQSLSLAPDLCTQPGQGAARSMGAGANSIKDQANLSEQCLLP